MPQGRWKFAEITQFQFGAALCFGAPAFDVAAGEARFVGVMTFPESGGYPLHENLAVAKEVLAANPALAEKVKAAEWTNGYTTDCFGSYAYAYEIPGAPFVNQEAPAVTSAPPPDTISSEGAAEQ